MNIPFSTLCQFFELESKEKKKFNKFKYLDTLIKSIKDKNEECDLDFYPLIRLLLPKCDKERYNYGVAELSIGKIYSELLNLSEKNSKLLMEWKKYQLNGDFAIAIYLK